jgi:NAD(P)H-hydrate epimerase
MGGQSGHLRSGDLKPLLRLAAAHDTVVLGPGIGRDRSTRQLVRALLCNPQFPGAVIDADALHALGTNPLPTHSAPRIMTPHVGEARAMLGEPSQAVGRWELLEHLVQAHPGCHLLKGSHTLIHDPKQPGIRVVDTNTQALATAGTGDVLAGMIAGLLAQGVSVAEAASLAAYLHGRAGESAAVDPNGLGVLAREVADRVPGEIARLRMPGLARHSHVLQDQPEE